MKSNKISFSPWQTKENSFTEDEDELINFNINLKPNTIHSFTLTTIPQNQPSHIPPTLTNLCRKSKQSTNRKNDLLSYSKTQTLNYMQSKDQNMNHKKTKKNTENSAKKSHRNDYEAKNQVKNVEQQLKKQPLDEKWKILSLGINQKLKNQNAEIRKYNKIAQELKSRRSTRGTKVSSASSRRQEIQKERPIIVALQEVSIKNFIIQGNYQQNDQKQQARRKQPTFLMKQKLATYRKTNVNAKENELQDQGRRKVVVVKQKCSNKQQESLLKVIKLERQINARIL